MGLGTLTLLTVLCAPAQAPAPQDPQTQTVYLPKLTTSIPIDIEESRLPELRETRLHYSLDGKAWNQLNVAGPDKRSYRFTAPKDGVYFLQIQAVSKGGDLDPANLNDVPPALKLVIDTKAPAITIPVAEKRGEEVWLSWDIQEANPKWDTFKLEYRGNDNQWHPIQYTADTLRGMAKFPIPTGGATAVRVSLTDQCRFRSEQEKEVTPARSAVASNPATSTRDPNVIRIQDAGIAESGPTLGSVKMPTTEAPAIVEPVPAARNAPVPVESVPSTSNTIATGAPPIERDNPNLPPIRMVNVTRLTLNYEITQQGPSGLSRAEAWATRDDGRTWIKWDATQKVDGSITVNLDQKNNARVEGVYGFRIVLVSGAGISDNAPMNGDLPDIRVYVDTTAPKVEVHEPIPHQTQKDVMVFRWTAQDQNMAKDPITLEWAESNRGPWYPIVSDEGPKGDSPALGANLTGMARRLPNTGEFAWKIPANFRTPAIYLKLTARDTAGNVSEAITSQQILVDMQKPKAKISGIP